MSSVIPSINCPPGDFAEVERQLAVARELSRWAHLDIADGIFTFHKSWNEPERWPTHPHIKTEVHCMVEDPLALTAAWSRAYVQRFIVHVETITPEVFGRLESKIRAGKRSLMLALSPETPPERLRPYLPLTLQFQILAVHPGLPGQKFLPLALQKISWIRRHIPNAIIEVDGGINPETARAARRAGADILVSHDYIFRNQNPAAAYEELISSF